MSSRAVRSFAGLLALAVASLLSTPSGREACRAGEPGPEAAATTNSLGMRLVSIPAGTFRMGSEAGDFDERPIREVTISRPFRVSATEVTNAQFEAFDPSHRALRGKLGFSREDDEAVVFVSWEEAVAFCRWLGEREGRPYRLPTEAEWEHACRAGTTTAYWTGEELPAGFLAEPRESWYPGRPEPTTSLRVARAPANAWGLHDVHGNVEEWCLDWYGQYPTEAETDPVGPESGDFRVTRGGSHSTRPHYLRSANRAGTLPEDRSWLIGFRVVQAEPLSSRPRPAAEPPRNRRVGITIGPGAEGPERPRDPALPWFRGPREYVSVPPGSEGPLYSRHNHCPALVACPNGDLLAIWYTCRTEPGRELAIAASRLRRGAEEWEAASPFWDAPDRNDHASALWSDETGTIWHFNGLSASATWGSLATVLRTSSDSGATWSRARLIRPEHGLRHMPVESVLRLRDGRILLPCDAVTGGSGGTAVLLSADGGRTWEDPGEGRPAPTFAAGETGAWIAGIHAPVVELSDGRLLAFGRGNDIDGCMPRSVSADGGRTWTYSASPFPPIGGGQRPVLLRLAEGPILFASFAREMTGRDASGAERKVSGLFATVSLDEGETWEARRLVTDDGPPRTVDGGGNTGKFTLGPESAEPRGYLSVCQTPDRTVHLIASKQHYAFNLAWLRAPMPAAGSGGSSTLELGTFACEVTPPEGHPLCGGWIQPLSGVDDPQLAKGIVLRDAGGTYVLCVLDWCELRNEAYDLFRERIAAAAGTAPSRVAVHCIHAHDAPLTDLRAQRILESLPGAPVHADLAFLERTAERVAAAAREAAGRMRPVTRLATGSAAVERVASNRRLLQADGSIRVRFSSAADPALREAPEGLVDPLLRTVAFLGTGSGGEETLACLHWYATHPQSHYGKGRATPDFPGIARERIEKETGAFQVYFTGCAGNVAAGKYNDGTPPRRTELADRVADAMRRSIAALERRPVAPISWKVRPVAFPLRKEPAEGAEAKRKVLEDPTAPAVQRIGAALSLATIERARGGTPIELTCLGIGDVRILHLPGEPFVEFQLEAARLRPDLFVAVAGYGDCAPGYICTEASYREGGYEPTASFLDPVSEGYLRGAVADLLGDGPIPAARLLEVRRIWDAAPHNAFTDLLRYRDRWLCAFREGQKHVSPEASIRVIRSADGREWESAALISVPGIDLRDAKLSVGPDGRLVLLGGWRTWPKEGTGAIRTWASFSEDGSSWTEPRLILGEGDWLWRILWHEGRAFGVAYRKPADRTWLSRLVTSADGVDRWETVADFSASPALAAFPGLTEATLRAGDAGVLHCLHRRDGGTRTALLGTSPPPFREWAWKDSGFYLGGPDAILHRGRWLAAGRWMVGDPRTVLARLDWSRGTLEPILELPSGGDTSYPGLATREEELWMSYYSSHEGKAAIYLARISIE